MSQGLCRHLMDAVECLLGSLGVKRMCLPAAHDAVETWLNGFGFQVMSEEEVRRETLSKRSRNPKL